MAKRIRKPKQKPENPIGEKLWPLVKELQKLKNPISRQAYCEGCFYVISQQCLDLYEAIAVLENTKFIIQFDAYGYVMENPKK